MTPRLRHPRRIRAIAVAVGVACNVAVWPFAHPARSDSLTSEIDKRMAELAIKPSAIDFVYQKGLQARNALLQSDFETLASIGANIIDQSRIQNWRYYPFTDFIDAIFAQHNPMLGEKLTELVAREKNAALPLLLRARFYVDAGWYKRGHGFVAETQPERMRIFGEFMSKALADVDAAIRLDLSNPYAFYLKMRILQGIGGASKPFATAFDDAITRFPTFYPLYDIALSTLQPRWGGSIDAMYAFVDIYAGNASEFSPLKLLYVDLYRYLLSTAYVACAARGGDRDRTAECIISFMQKSVRPGLEPHVLAALQLYDHTDKYQFGIAVKHILSDMLRTSGGESYAGAVLQLAASSMHSDTQLKEDKQGGHNDYVIDELVAESWRQKRGFVDNEVTKYKEALADAQWASFPSEEEKHIAVAWIYGQLAEVAATQHQYIDEIAYGKAALALGVTWDEPYVCHGYYQLKHYTEAIESCTSAINHTGNSNALYWRGAAYEKAGKLDEALADFKTVADNEFYFASGAAIAMSMIYSNRNDLKGALDVLNRYTFLYDPNRTIRSDVAVAYNNRCYLYKKLGELKKALEDCTASLRYGSIPDAFRKQQELVKQLGGQ